MTQPQWLSLATLGGMMALFLWGRFRYDVTAVIALLFAMAIGVVSPDAAFTGFSDDIVVIVGSALVLSAAVVAGRTLRRQSGCCHVNNSLACCHLHIAKRPCLSDIAGLCHPKHCEIKLRDIPARIG